MPPTSRTRKTAVSRKSATPLKAAKAPTGRGADRVSLDLDNLEREDGAEVPFAAVINGRRIEFIDAAELAWDFLVELDDPREFIENTLSEDDLQHLLDAQLPGWKFNALWEGYQAHYGLGDRGNARA